MLSLASEVGRHVDEQDREFCLGFWRKAFQCSCEPDELWFNFLARTHPIQLGGEDLLLTLLGEPARHSPPKNVFLGLDAFAEKAEANITEPP